MKRAWFGIVTVVAAGGWLLACGGGKTAPSAATAAPEAKTVSGTIVALGPGEQKLPVGVAVYKPGDYRKIVWEGLAGETYELKPGRYDLLIEHYGQKYWRRGEDLGGGEKVFRLPMATLAVETRSSRGDKLEGAVAVFGPGGRNRPAMEGAAFEELPLLAGSYDIRVRVQGRDRWLAGVALEEGDREKRVVVEPVGYLRAVAVDEQGEPLEAEVWVYTDAAAHTPTAMGASGQTLALLPGTYDIVARWAGREDYSAGVAVVANQTTEERFTFRRGENE